MTEADIIHECPCGRYFALRVSRKLITVQRNEPFYSVQVAAYAAEDRREKAVRMVDKFHERLCK